MPGAAWDWLNSPAILAWKHVLGILLTLVLAIWLVQVVSDENITTKLQTYSDENREHVQGALLNVCSDEQLDRIDDARAWTQAAKVWKQRANDLQLSRPERLRARRTSFVYSESAKNLRDRLYKCIPLVRREERVRDLQARREVLGKVNRRSDPQDAGSGQQP